MAMGIYMYNIGHEIYPHLHSNIVIKCCFCLKREKKKEEKLYFLLNIKRSQLYLIEGLIWWRYTDNCEFKFTKK